MQCSHCGGTMQSAGVREFRTGGTTGGWKLFLGEWAELGEEMLPLELWYCPSCRKVELFLANQR